MRDPAHYVRLKPEPWDVIAAWRLPYDLGCVVKYISRAGHKSGNTKLADLKKAAEFLRHAIETEERYEQPQGDPLE